MAASGSTVRWLAGIALSLGALAGLCLASMYLLNPYPAHAGCESSDGYAAIKAHADTNADLALTILVTGIAGAVVCVVGTFMAAGRRGWFVAGLLPFLVLCFFGLAALIASGLSCQN